MPLEVCPLCADDSRVRAATLEDGNWLVCDAHDPPFRIVRPEESATATERPRRRHLPEGPTQQEWASYERWNEAIFKALFSNADERPVYIDLEEDALRKIARDVEVGLDTAQDALTLAVKTTLVLPPTRGRLLHHHLDRERRWARSGRDGAPPFLAVLALFSLVAEGMVNDGEFRDTNYYARLCQALGLDTSDRQVKDKVARDFRNQSHALWEGLNDWILDGDGARGIPTAEAFDYRVHVGIPMSQALIREADRQKLPGFFETARLQPGQHIAAGDMVRVLEDWLPTSTMSAAVKRAWRRGAMKERIAAIVCGELEGWTGELAEDDGLLTIPIRLVAQLATFPVRRLRLEPLVRAAGPEAEGRYLISDENARAVLSGQESVRLVRRVGRWLALQNGHQATMADLMVASLRLRHENQNVVIHRRSRRIVVLEENQDYGWLEEVDRPQLGSNLLILAVEPLAAEVRTTLEAASRPGYSEYSVGDLPGLPEPWVGFHNVQLMSVPEVEDPDLSPLVPVAWTQLTLAGGLRLPGHFEAWHPHCPPEARATTTSDEPFLVILRSESIKDEQPTEDHGQALEEFTGAAVVRVPEGLQDGDYRVTLHREGSNDPVATRRLRIRSADHPLPIVSNPAERLIHASNHLFGISAERASRPSSGSWIEGGLVVGGLTTNQTDLPGASLDQGTPGSEEPEDEDPAERPQRPIVAAASCFATGAHYFDLPDYRGRARSSRVEGICRHCGLERWWPARPPRRRELSGEDEESSIRRSTQVRPIEPAQPIDFDTFLDAISCVRSGTWPAFERMASYADASPWFPTEAAWLLSALGHLEVIRDTRSLRPVAWEVTRPSIVMTAAGGVLCGFRSRSLLTRVKDAAAHHRLDVEIEPKTTSPGRVAIEGASESIASLGAELDGWWGEGVPVIDSAPERMCSLLRLGNELVEMLPTAVPPHGVSVERFRPELGAWEPVSQTGESGAYRFSSRPRRYMLRTQDDTAFRIGDARLVKHLSAALAGRTLLGYDHEHGSLLAPIGAALPGLYERVAVLCSGHPPKARTDGLLEYPSVPRAIAAELAGRLLAVGSGVRG